MAKYMFAYHGGGMPETPEDGERMMRAWTEWYGEMGAAVVDAGAAAGQSHTVTSGGHAENGGANPVSGYTIVEAADHEAACGLARGCPMVADGSGSVEVATLIEM